MGNKKETLGETAKKRRRDKKQKEEKSINMHSLGRHFIERVNAVDYASVETDPSSKQPPGAKFNATVRGWGNNNHQHRASSLLAMQEEKRMAKILGEQHILLIPKEWWPNKTHTLEPQEPGWWYVVSEVTQFRECGICPKRIGKDLDKATLKAHGKECLGCQKILGMAKKSRKKRVPTDNKESGTDPTESPRSEQSITSLRPTRSSSRKVAYKDPSSNEEETFEEEPSPVTKGYLCTSADPKRAGRAEGGESVILTAAEIRTLLHNQTALGDQRVWRTTAQMGFPTTPLEDEVSERKDLQLGKPTARRLHPEISEFICRLQEEISISNRPLSPEEDALIEMERAWGTRDLGNDEPMTEDIGEETRTNTSWEPNPPPLMAKGPGFIECTR